MERAEAAAAINAAATRRRILKELNNELEINASAERVWHVLTDFASFPRWNPFLQRVSGELTAGRRLDVPAPASGTHGATSRPTRLNQALKLRAEQTRPAA